MQSQPPPTTSTQLVANQIEWCFRNMAAGEGPKRKGRKRRNSDENGDGGSTARTLKQYSIDEKLEIIQFAKSNGNRAAGREYNVAESSIREWRKNEEKLRTMNVTDPERNRLNTSARKMPIVAVENISPEVKKMRVPLSLTMANDCISVIPQDTMNPENEVASLGASSAGSNHSGSPTLSVADSAHGSVNGSASGCSRRKCKRPMKVVTE